MRIFQIELNENLLTQLGFLDNILMVLLNSKREEIERNFLFERVNEVRTIEILKFNMALSYLQKKELITSENDLFKITYGGVLKLSEGGFVGKYESVVEKKMSAKKSELVNEKVQRMNLFNGKLWLPYSIIVLLIALMGLMVTQSDVEGNSEMQNKIELNDSIQTPSYNKDSTNN